MGFLVSATGDFVSSVDLESIVAACGGDSGVEDPIVNAATSQTACEEKGHTSSQRCASIYCAFLWCYGGLSGAGST